MCWRNSESAAPECSSESIKVLAFYSDLTYQVRLTEVAELGLRTDVQCRVQIVVDLDRGKSLVKRGFLFFLIQMRPGKRCWARPQEYCYKLSVFSVLVLSKPFLEH